MSFSLGYSPYRPYRIRRKASNPELLVVTSGNPPRYGVMNRRGGTSYFGSRQEARAALGRMRNPADDDYLPSASERGYRAVHGPSVWLGGRREESSSAVGPQVWLKPGSERSAVSEETTPSKGRRKTMRRRKSRGKRFIRFGGKKVSWRGLVKRFGVKGAKSKWRKAKKIGGGSKRRSRKGRRKGRRGGRRTAWMRLVRRYGVKGASCRYTRKGKKRRSKRRR